MASSGIGSIERPATNLVTQLRMYILVAGRRPRRRGHNLPPLQAMALLALWAGG